VVGEVGGKDGDDNLASRIGEEVAAIPAANPEVDG